jgi:hypothetical protein
VASLARAAHAPSHARTQLRTTLRPALEFTHPPLSLVYDHPYFDRNPATSSVPRKMFRPLSPDSARIANDLLDANCPAQEISETVNWRRTPQGQGALAELGAMAPPWRRNYLPANPAPYSANDVRAHRQTRASGSTPWASGNQPARPPTRAPAPSLLRPPTRAPSPGLLRPPTRAPSPGLLWPPTRAPSPGLFGIPGDGFRQASGASWPAVGHGVISGGPGIPSRAPFQSSSSVTGYRLSNGMPCDRNSNAFVAPSSRSVTGYRTTNGLPCDINGHNVVKKSTASITGLKNDAGLPCDIDGHRVVFQSIVSPTRFARQSGVPCDANGHRVPGVSMKDLDMNAPERLPCPPAPPNAIYKKRAAMMSRYSGEETGEVWGTRVKYMDTAERQEAKLTFDSFTGLIFDPRGRLFDTTSCMNGFDRGHAIFVMDHNGDCYASYTSIVGKIHHSTFLAGQPVATAGSMMVRNGQLLEVTRRSGHYRPTVGQHIQVVDSLQRRGITGFISNMDV